MKTTINKTQFVSAFADMGRGHNFSREGREMLFDWLKDYEESTGEEIEFDPIAICCEWSEVDEDEARREYSHLDGIDECEDLDDIAELLNDETMVLNTGNTIVVAVF